MVSQHWTLLHVTCYDFDQSLRIVVCDMPRECLTDRNIDDAFQLGSSCYKVHKNEEVNWFTAVNKCLSNNATLAVFDDNVRQYFPSSVLSEPTWIGLLKSWWTWPALGKLKPDNITSTLLVGIIKQSWSQFSRPLSSIFNIGKFQRSTALKELIVKFTRLTNTLSFNFFGD